MPGRTGRGCGVSLTLALRHEDRAAVLSALGEKNETAWFAVCAPGPPTVVCHRLQAVPESMYSERRPDRLMIRSPAWVPLARDAAKRGLGLLFAHTHPRHWAAFSMADDAVERTLRSDLNNMAPGVELTSAVFAGGADGRIEFAARSGRLPDADTRPITRLRFAGRELHICDNRPGNGAAPAAFFDRQIRAFGTDGQAALGRIRAGVVGLGGTGSATAQQLLRLGVGHLCIVDDDIVTDTSLTRGWGSRRDDIGRPKTEVIRRLAREIGLGTTVEAVNGRCTETGIVERLSALDVIFGCTDDHAGRIKLNRLAYGHNIALIDCGVLITDAGAGDGPGARPRIESRVTWVAPGSACLLCRGRIDPAIAAAESLSEDERERRRQEGYIPDLDEPQPAVIAYTTTISGMAVSELLNRMFGLANPDATEAVLKFEMRKLSHNDRRARDGCWCASDDMQHRQPLLAENAAAASAMAAALVCDNAPAAKNAVRPGGMTTGRTAADRPSRAPQQAQ